MLTAKTHRLSKPSRIKMNHVLSILLSVLLLLKCSSTGDSSQPSSDQQAAAQRIVPQFVGDSAYRAIEQQLAFGPRVPGSKAQEQCAQWLQTELSRYGATVSVMRSTVTAYDGTTLPCINLVGSFHPELQNRILLISHWDSRHVADEDPDPSKRNQPVPAANDGASGVGVLLEIARQVGRKQPRFGIDIFLTDAEDYGAPDSWSGSHDEKFWALGTQQWCKQPHLAGYQANFGILLDMVGAPDATFYREYYSDQYASDVVNLIWQKAKQLGYQELFIDQKGAGITDDHLFVNRQRHIPTVDIIDTRLTGNGTFYPYWHTTDDTLDKLSVETLQKVGDVLMHVIY